MRFRFPWRAWSLESLTPDWGILQSAYDHIGTVSKESLPDDAEVAASGDIQWASGAFDGVMGHHFGGSSSNETPAIYDRIRELIARADNERFGQLYKTLMENSCLSYIGALLKRLNDSRSSVDFDRLHAIALYLSKKAPHREPVKAGLALLGSSGSESDLGVVIALGRNEEFTLFAAQTAARLSPDPESTLWDMAKEVNGWGRIQIVERLSDTRRTDIQQWMLREGFKNSVMNEYLACTCARAGRLHEALASSPIDAALLDGAAGLFRAMLADGPAEKLDDYEHAGEATERYVNHVWASPDAGTQHYLALRDLGKYLDEMAERDGDLPKWDAALRLRLAATIQDILHWETWREKVERGLRSQDRYEFWLADQVAGELGIDTWKIHFNRVKAAPLDSNDWYSLLKQSGDGRIDAVLDFASTAIPLAAIATGPANEQGFGPGWKAHSALDWVLQELSRFPMKGWPFIEAGLRSPVVRNRNMAVRALASWPRDSWPQGATALFESALSVEPDALVKERLGKLLAGLPVD